MSYQPPGPPTYPSGAFGPIAPQPQPGNRRTLTLVLAAIVTVLALVLAAGIVLVVKARNGDINIPGLTLTAADDPGVDPFTDPVVVSNANLSDDIRLSAQAGAPDQGARTVNGTQPGLYASNGSAMCDTAALSNQLMANPPAAQAWASVFGISPASIPYYLNTLTPVVLTADTWVTNHTYTSGRARPFQSVLQAGTSVYVDAAGVPRAVCSCGNPLAPPAAAPIGGYRVTGDPWPAYRTNTVTRVAYNNQNVTTINNTTTIVPGTPTPAAGDPTNPVLTILNLLTRALAPQQVGGGLNLTGVPPLTEPLPTPAALNTAFVPDTEEDAADNGLARAGSPQVAAEVTERAAENGGMPEGAPDSSANAGSDAPAASDAASAPAGSSVPGSSSAPDSSAPHSSAPDSSGASSSAPDSSAASSSSSAAPSPTSFSGSGDRIGSFTVEVDERSVSCTVPETATAVLLELDCSDSATRRVSAGALGSSAVNSATDSSGVWTVSLTEGAVPKRYAVVSATWTTVPTTTETPTTTEAPTTEAPTTTEEVPTTEAPAPEPETPTTTVEELPAPGGASG